MPPRFTSLRGFHDILPGESERWQRFEAAVRDRMRRYGLREIRPPMLEATELFTRSVGEGTDIVGKEMFTLAAGDESVTLRPELTASVCRAFVEHGLDRLGQTRLYYIGAAFRKERPQKGRLRQFHQIGAELFGEPAPGADVETIALAWELVQLAGVPSPRLTINSLGDAAAREAHRTALIAFLRAREDQLDPDSRARIDRNPLRVLDSKLPATKRALQGAPLLLDHLEPEAREHFEAVQAGLRAVGVPFELDPHLVRGLDYYVRTTFEIAADTGGSQNAVLGGGRYDRLLASLGGPDLAGIGFAAGIERLLLAAGAAPDAPAPLDAFVVTLGAAAAARALALVQALRAAGVAVLWDPGGRNLSGQMKRAHRCGARHALVLGDDELAQGEITVRSLASGAEQRLRWDVASLAAALRGPAPGADRTEGEGDDGD